MKQNYLKFISFLILTSFFLPLNSKADIKDTEQKLTVSDVSGDRYYGYSSSISGNNAIIGAPKESNADEPYAGSAYVFVKINDKWTEVAKLTASDGAGYDNFGSSSSISDNYAIIGAPSKSNADEPYAGSAYVFEKINGKWTEVAKLTASDGAAYDNFGSSSSISDNYAIIGAPAKSNADQPYAGSAYVFERINGKWTEVAKLTASDGAAYDNFGWSSSISDNYAIIGAPAKSNADKPYTGSAYVFEKINGKWTEVAKLTASDGVANAYFGYSLSISGNYANIGAPFDDDKGAKSGSAYVFERINGIWTEAAKLTASDGAANDYFGLSSSISANYAIIGAPNESNDNGFWAGSAYVYEKINGKWMVIAKLAASDLATGDAFGWSSSISDNNAIIGAPYYDDNGNLAYAGSVYVYELTTPSSETDHNSNLSLGSILPLLLDP